MPFTYKRIIRFADTDAAGVVYFANVLSICHEAYEASLIATNIDLKTFMDNSLVAIPIVHAEIDFLRPLFCGDEIRVVLQPEQLSSNKFKIIYQILGLEKQLIAKAITQHTCINSSLRTKQDLVQEILLWLQFCKT